MNVLFGVFLSLICSADLERERQVSVQEAQAFAHSHGFPFLEISAKEYDEQRFYEFFHLIFDQYQNTARY
jgi:hypothetical protein